MSLSSQDINETNNNSIKVAANIKGKQNDSMSSDILSTTENTILENNLEVTWKNQGHASSAYKYLKFLSVLKVIYYSKRQKQA